MTKCDMGGGGLENGPFWSDILFAWPLRISRKIEQEKVRVLQHGKKNIWYSELYANNKVSTGNTFAVPVLSPTFGILEKTKEEILQTEVNTRKLLCLKGSFHRITADCIQYETKEVVE